MQAHEISREFARNRVRRAAAGDSWLALTFSRDRSLLFSWDPEYYGVCRVTPEEIRALEGASSSRPPVIDAVRSHIVGADLSGALQINRDRVLKIEFRRVIGAGFFQARFVIFEACGRYSNIIVADEADCVIEAAKHIMPDSNRYRSIIPGHPYAAPPDFGGVFVDEFDAAGPDIYERLDSIRGLGKPLIGALKTLPEGDLLRALEFYKNSDGDALYQVFPSPKNYVTACTSPLTGSIALSAQDPLSASRSVVVARLTSRRVEARKKKISSKLDVIERANDRKIGEYAALSSDKNEVELLKREGTLILSNAYAIPPRASSAILTEWTDDGPAELRVELNPEKDASANAEARFARYRRKKSAVDAAGRILPELYRKRGEIDEQRALLACNDDWNTLAMMLGELEPKSPQVGNSRGKKPSENIPPHRRLEFPEFGAIIFWGLSAKGNRHVTFKLAKGDDIWFHAQDIPGTHVILRFDANPDDAAFSRMIDVAASCAARHSGGGDVKVRVDYTERRHVRAIQGAGLANVTYKEFKTILADSELWLEAAASWSEDLPDRRG